MSWAWPRLQKSGPAKTGPAGPLATALGLEMKNYVPVLGGASIVVAL